MRIVQTSEPAHEPVLLEEVKAYLRIDSDLEDAAISGFTAAARAVVEAATGLYLIGRNIDVYADAWPDLSGQGSAGLSVADKMDTLVPGLHTAAFLMLPVRPVSLINAITLFDATGEETEWAAENYALQPGLDSTVRLASGASWPQLSRPYDAIKMSLTVGFGPDWNTVPELIQQAIIKVAAKLYVSRGDDAMPSVHLLQESGAAGLLHSFRRVRL